MNRKSETQREKRMRRSGYLARAEYAHYVPSSEVEEVYSAILNDAALYRATGRLPYHAILRMESGEGQTSFLRGQAAVFRPERLINYSSSEEVLEITFDGTLPQIKEAFRTVDHEADYENVYRGIVGLHCEELVAGIGNKELMDTFIEEAGRLCNTAWVHFFLPCEEKSASRLIGFSDSATDTCRGKKTEQLADMILRKIGRVRDIGHIYYEPHQLARILFYMMSDTYHVFVENMGETHTMAATLQNLVLKNHVKTIKELRRLADGLADTCVDFRQGTPTLVEELICKEYRLPEKQQERRTK